GYALGARIDRGRSPPETKIHVEFVRALPDAGLRLALPERLRQRRSCVGWMLFGGDEADRAAWIGFANGLSGSSGGHPAADDKIIVPHAVIAFIERLV